YRPDEDIIRFNCASETFQVKAGDYARVVDTDHARNKITVLFDDGRTLRYNPKRLSGVSVFSDDYTLRFSDSRQTATASKSVRCCSATECQTTNYLRDGGAGSHPLSQAARL
ncbi:MAG: hypothetical protein ACREBG_29840, partial [Pyrinomonadaceae bacterium]